MHPLPSLERAAAQAEAQLRATFARLDASIEAQLHAVDARMKRAIATADARMKRSFADRTSCLDRVHCDAVRPELPRGPLTDPSTITIVPPLWDVSVTDAAAQCAIQELLLRRPRPPHPDRN